MFEDDSKRDAIKVQLNTDASTDGRETSSGVERALRPRPVPSF
jgi:hypothetical protein